MLILARKEYERIILDNSIIVTINEIDGKNVRVGIDAPDKVKIYREEILTQEQMFVLLPEFYNPLSTPID